MGKSNAFFAAVLAAGCGFWVAPTTFAEDRNGLAPPSTPDVLGAKYTGPIAPQAVKAVSTLPMSDKARAEAAADFASASNPLVAPPSTFGSSSTFDDWLKKLEKKVFQDLTGKDLPADCADDFKKAFKELRKQGKGHEGGSGPRGSLVFYADHLAYSNGDGTVIATDASGTPNPRVGEGSPLGWAEASAGPGGGGSGGTASTGTATSSGGGSSTGATTAGGGAPAAPLPEIDLSKLPANVKAMVEKANWITQQHYPYLWGGGHNMQFSGPYDCSGSVSAVLHAGGVLNSPMVAKDFMNWGAPGPGVVTIYACPTHVYMAINGKFFGTSTSNPGGGAAWFNGSARAGFVVRHVPLVDSK